MKPPWVTRFAPSPTGAMHLGNARTLVLTWWWARASGAEIVLRIEDLDHPRKKSGALEGLREDLAWLGLDYDRETPLQTTRILRHREALEALTARGLAYYCACSRKDVDEAQSAPHETGHERTYAGTCRGRFASAESARDAAGRSPALRFRVGAEAEEFEDLVLGPQSLRPAEAGGDFVVARAEADGLRPAYQVAVVVDDADDGVTRVVRGDDLLVSAARQRLLQRALGLPATEYGHVPLVVGADGRRLAKRHGDTRLSALRERGVPPERVWEWIARSIGVPPAPPEELVRRGFDPAWIPLFPIVPPPELA